MGTRCAIIATGGPAFAAALILAGCCADQPMSLPSDDSARSALVLPVAVPGEPPSETPLVALIESDPALAGRLDGTMGMRRSDATYYDVTDTWILDQQYTWNGHVYDNYLNQQTTYRRVAK